MLKKLIKGNDSDTERIGRALSDLKKASIDNDIAVILVSHPTKINEGQKVTAYSVSGSANFFNLSDYMFTLTADRDRFKTTIEILKVRDDTKGVMGGTCTLDYDDVHLKYSDTDSSTEDSTEDTSTPSQHDTPKDINKDIATDVMKAIMEETKQAKQEDRQPAAKASQPATQPAGTTKAAPAVKEEVRKEEKQVQRITPDFLRNTKVSIMKQHKVLNESNLYNAIITGRICKQEIAKVRSIDRSKDEIAYKQAKSKVLSYTPSCLCQGETAKEIKQVNPLIAVDIDAKDNEGVSIEEMRKKINSLPFVMYSSMSVGGRGMYALIAILEDNKNDFKGVFKALESDFKGLGLTLDNACVNVNRERYMSYDDNEYWNTKAEIYDKKISTPTQGINNNLSKGGINNANKPLTEKDKQKVDLMIEDIKANKIQLSKNHKDTLGLANCLANIMGEEGRELLHIIRQQRSGYDEFKIDKTFDEMLDKIDDNERYGLGFLISKYKEAKQGQTQAH